jgi:hypothetical protein
MMIERFREHGSHQANVVRATGQVRQEIGELHSGLAMLREHAWTGHHFCGRLDKGQAKIFVMESGREWPSISAVRASDRKSTGWEPFHNMKMTFFAFARQGSSPP